MVFEQNDIESFTNIIKKLIKIRESASSGIQLREFRKIGFGSEYPRRFTIDYYKNTKTILIGYEIYDYAYSDGLNGFISEVVRQKFDTVKSADDINFIDAHRIIIVGIHAYQLYVTGLKFPNLHISPFPVSVDNENEIENEYEKWWFRDYPDLKCGKLEINHIRTIEDDMKRQERRNTEDMRAYIDTTKKLVNTVYCREIIK